MATSPVRISESGRSMREWTPPPDDSHQWELFSPLEGVYCGSRLVDTKYGQRDYYLVEVKGVIEKVWGTFRLRQFFADVAVGEWIEIHYKGVDKTTRAKQFLCYREERS